MHLFLGVVFFISCCIVVADETCPICKKQLYHSDINQQLCCSHSFHSACIARWNSEHDSCPVCRKKIILHTQRYKAKVHDCCVHNPDQRALSKFDHFVSAEELRRLLNILETTELPENIVGVFIIVLEHSVSLATSLSQEQLSLISRIRNIFSQLLSEHE